MRSLFAGMIMLSASNETTTDSRTGEDEGGDIIPSVRFSTGESRTASSTPTRAKLSREEPDAGNLHVREWRLQGGGTRQEVAAGNQGDIRGQQFFGKKAARIVCRGVQIARTRPKAKVVQGYNGSCFIRASHHRRLVISARSVQLSTRSMSEG